MRGMSCDTGEYVSNRGVLMSAYVLVNTPAKCQGFRPQYCITH